MCVLLTVGYSRSRSKCRPAQAGLLLCRNALAFILIKNRGQLNHEPLLQLLQVVSAQIEALEMFKQLTLARLAKCQAIQG